MSANLVTSTTPSEPTGNIVHATPTRGCVGPARVAVKDEVDRDLTMDVASRILGTVWLDNYNQVRLQSA